MIRIVLSVVAFFALMGVAFAAAPLEQRLGDALRADALLPDGAEVRLLEVTPVRGAVQTVEISRFDPRTGYFTAVIGHGDVRKSISGRASVTVPVVVTRSTLRREHVLQSSDLELRQVSLAQVPGTAYAFPEDLEGMSLRRSLPAGRPIREGDVGAPVVLRKNSSIEIVYETPGMQLVARGRALEDGAVGDRVRIIADGGNIVAGEVAGPSQVIVR